MDDKHDEQDYESKKDHSNKVLNTFLSLIVLITVATGAILYYSLYKYTKDDKELQSELKANENKTEAEISTVADIIDTALNTNTTEDANTVDGNATVNTNTTTVTTGEADNRKVLNEAIIVLYKGLILDSDDMGVVELKYIDNSNPSKDNYVITYYNYENYGFKNSSLGTLSNQVIDGLVKIDNVGKVAISEKYEAIPREIQVVNAIPAVVLDNNSDLANYDTKKTIITDLDGNGTNEYILILASKVTGESRILLVESTGLIKATIAKMDKSGWEEISSDGYYLSYSNIEVLDIDNDGIMEILFEVPNSSGTPSQVSLLKYKNGDLAGVTDYICSLK
ncbi:MAG: hypothetical protein IJ867_07010 [Clostridia bacterium]|nr:hypothetical protein [Clostridia bacterium]